MKNFQEKKIEEEKLALERSRALLENRKITLEEEKLALERSRVLLENRKITLEEERLSLEQTRLATSTLLQNFDFHWQRLLNYESENNRWISIYISALIFGLAWLINSKDYHGLQELFRDEKNSYLLLSLSLVNSIYTLSLAIRGYWIKSLEIFIHKKIVEKIPDPTNINLHIWIKPKPVKNFYYAIRGSLPTAVSLLILYFDLVYNLFSPDRGYSFWSFYLLMAILVLLSIGYSLRTIWAPREV